MMRTFPGVSIRRRRGALFALASVLVLGLWSPAQAKNEPLPGSCKLHPTQVVNPGCLPALTDEVTDAVNGITAPVLDPPETYPDLVPDVTVAHIDRPVLGVDPNTFEITWGPLSLYFDTYAQNLGSVAVDLVSDEPTNIDSPPVSQCVAWTADVCRKRRLVGGFTLHPQHNHFHFNEFARYELRTLLPDGTPDYSAGGLVGMSDKVSFCLIDSKQVRPDARPVPGYVGCTPTREGISAGWTDIYTADLDGQHISLGGLGDGRYAVVIALNYGGNVYESDYTNNKVEVTVEVSNGVSEATIVDRRWP